MQKCGGKGSSDDNPFQINFGDLEVVRTDLSLLTVSGMDHGKMFVGDFTDISNKDIDVVVSNSSAYVDGMYRPHVGTVMLFVQMTSSKIRFATTTGVTIHSPGQLETYGTGSTVSLTSIAENEWVLGGDVLPLPEIVV